MGTPLRMALRPYVCRRAWGWARAGSNPAETAASFIDLLTPCRLTLKSYLARSLAWTDVRSPRLSTRSSGMGTSRPLSLLFPVTSGLREMIGKA